MWPGLCRFTELVLKWTPLPYSTAWRGWGCEQTWRGIGVRRTVRCPSWKWRLGGRGKEMEALWEREGDGGFVGEGRRWRSCAAENVCSFQIKVRGFFFFWGKCENTKVRWKKNDDLNITGLVFNDGLVYSWEKGWGYFPFPSVAALVLLA